MRRSSGCPAGASTPSTARGSCPPSRRWRRALEQMLDEHPWLDGQRCRRGLARRARTGLGGARDGRRARARAMLRRRHALWRACRASCSTAPPSATAARCCCRADATPSGLLDGHAAIDLDAPAAAMLSALRDGTRRRRRDARARARRGGRGALRAVHRLVVQRGGCVRAAARGGRRVRARGGVRLRRPGARCSPCPPTPRSPRRCASC